MFKKEHFIKFNVDSAFMKMYLLMHYFVVEHCLPMSAGCCPENIVTHLLFENSKKSVANAQPFLHFCFFADVLIANAHVLVSEENYYFFLLLLSLFFLRQINNVCGFYIPKKASVCLDAIPTLQPSNQVRKTSRV